MSENNWMGCALVQDAVYRRMTGVSKHWLNWLFEDFSQVKPARLLSLCCDGGGHELLLARMGYATELIGVEADPEKVASARKKASDERLTVNFQQATIDEYLDVNSGEKFDVILMVNALDQARDVERACRLLSRMLTPNGLICLTEYIGPRRGIYPNSQVRIVNRFLRALDPEFRTDPESAFTNPQDTRSDVVEGRHMRPEAIAGLMETYFSFLLKRYCGGGLLQPIFSQLRLEKINDGSIESRNVARLLISAEESLTQAGVIRDNLIFAICRGKD